MMAADSGIVFLHVVDLQDSLITLVERPSIVTLVESTSIAPSSSWGSPLAISTPSTPSSIPSEADFAGASGANPQIANTEESTTQNTNGECDEEPIYVNAKQYSRIMKRRATRAKMESEGRIPKERRKYMHESRHRHALSRKRDKSGKFDGDTCVRDS